MAAQNGKLVRLTNERFRRLEQRMEAVERALKGTNARLDQTNARLDTAVDVLTRLVQVVAAQNERMNRNFTQLGARLDRMTRAIMTGRTQDLQRMSRAERRLDGAERRLQQLERQH